MKPAALFFVPLLSIAALGACTSVPESSPSSEAWDSGGVRIVHSDAPRWTPGLGWSISEQPYLSIGVLNGPEEYQFVGISAAALQSDGDVVVVDRGARVIRLFDGEGAYVRTLGGPGSGPGEFTDPRRVTVTPGDTVVVWDQALFRMTRFDAEGELLEVRTVDLANISKAVEPPLYPLEIEPLADGGFLVRLIEKTAKVTSPGASRPNSGALRVSPDLSGVDTLMFFEDLEEVTVEAPWGPFSVPPPLGKRTQISHRGDPSRICIGEQKGPEITCFEPNGDRTSVRWNSKPTSPAQYEIVSWREESIRLYSLKLSPDQVEEMLDQIPIPKIRPDYDEIVLDASGNLWVEVGPTAEGPSSWRDFLVFDDAGPLLGTVSLPPIHVLEIGDDYVMGVFEDELEIQYLHLYEIRKPRATEELPD